MKARIGWVAGSMATALLGCATTWSASAEAGGDALARPGQKAAPLAGLAYIKGDPVTLEKGKVYVIEFWATWCAPCRKGIPHLTKLQENYGARGVTVLGISTESNRAKVEAFVERQGKAMDYTVAMDAEGKTAAGYMEAFGQEGIPCAFIVDGAGKVVWCGHPMMGMDAVLEQVVNGTFDPDAHARAEAERAATQARVREMVQRYFDAVENGSTIEETRPAAEQILASADEVAQCALAWQIMMRPGVEDAHRDLEIALKAATRANQVARGEHPIVLDVYATALARNGRLEEAVAAAREAVERVSHEEVLRPDMEARLEALEAKLAEQTAPASFR